VTLNTVFCCHLSVTRCRRLYLLLLFICFGGWFFFLERFSRKSAFTNFFFLVSSLNFSRLCERDRLPVSVPFTPSRVAFSFYFAFPPLSRFADSGGCLRHFFRFSSNGIFSPTYLSPILTFLLAILHAGAGRSHWCPCTLRGLLPEPVIIQMQLLVPFPFRS